MKTGLFLSSLLFTGTIFLSSCALAPTTRLSPEEESSLRKECEVGNSKSCYNLAYAEEKAGNISEARDLFHKSCRMGYYMACWKMERELDGR